MIKKYFRLYKYIGPYIKEQVMMSLLCVLGIGVSILIPYLMAIFINAIQDMKGLEILSQIAIFIGVISIVASILNTVQNYVWHRFRTRFINYIRSKMFNAIMENDLVYFKQNKSGDIISKILYDATLVAEHIAIGIPMLLINIFRLIFVFLFMYMIDAKLTLIVLATTPIYYFTFNIINKRLRENSGKEREEFSKITNELQDDFIGVTTIKIFKKEKYFNKKLNQTLLNYEKFINKNLFFKAISYGTTDMIVTLLPVIILFVGSVLISNGQFKIGSLMGFYTYLNYIYEPIRNLSDWFVGVQTTLGMSNRITDILDKKYEVSINDDEYSINEIKTIEFKDVSFAYNQNKVLEKVNFKLEKGDKVAIIGASGSGKSTIVSLLMKIYLGYSGEILINNISLDKIGKENLYEKLSIVEQNLFVFNGTMNENIFFDDEKKHNIKEILRVSRCDEFINLENNDMNKVLSEGGGNISGGQKQRICICRALAKLFDVLILDESTSSLDAELEDEIIKNIDEYTSKNKNILIMISHREKPLSICNKIIDLGLI